MKKQNTILFYALAFGVFVSLAIVFSITTQGGLYKTIVRLTLPQNQKASVGEVSTSASVLSDIELSNLVKPSVVRILMSVEGEISINDFDITIPASDVKNPKITELKGAKPITIPVKDVVISGSGFVVNPDGYIVTNAHVAGNDLMIKRMLVSGITADVYMGAILELVTRISESDAKKYGLDKISKEEIEKEHTKFLLDAIDFVAKKSTFAIKIKMTVLRQGSKGEKVSDFESRGFPAKLIYTNPDFAKDDKDIAILKIEEKNLPALVLGTSENLSSGQQIYIFGFPGNADFAVSNFLESSFTKGTISAIKDSVHGSLKVFQTDAKISKGSSGGPSFDINGKVSGITTLLTGDASDGDTFAVLLPVDIAKKALSDNFIINSEGLYGPHFRNGLRLLSEKHCKESLKEFGLAGETNKNFGIDKILEPYITQCNDLIATGQSIDTGWDEFVQKIKGVSSFVWIIAAAGGIMAILLVVLAMIFSRRLKKEKEEIDHLEHIIGDGNITHAMSSPLKADTTNAPEEQISQATNKQYEQAAVENDRGSQFTQLVQYVKAAKTAGMTDANIILELKKTGWGDEDIAKAFATQ